MKSRAEILAELERTGVESARLLRRLNELLPAAAGETGVYLGLRPEYRETRDALERLWSFEHALYAELLGRPAEAHHEPTKSTGLLFDGSELGSLFVVFGEMQGTTPVLIVCRDDGIVHELDASNLQRLLASEEWVADTGHLDVIQVQALHAAVGSWWIKALDRGP